MAPVGSSVKLLPSEFCEYLTHVYFESADMPSFPFCKIKKSNSLLLNTRIDHLQSIFYYNSIKKMNNFVIRLQINIITHIPSYPEVHLVPGLYLTYICGLFRPSKSCTLQICTYHAPGWCFSRKCKLRFAAMPRFPERMRVNRPVWMNRSVI